MLVKKKTPPIHRMDLKNEPHPPGSGKVLVGILRNQTKSSRLSVENAEPFFADFSSGISVGFVAKYQVRTQRNVSEILRGFPRKISWINR